MSVVELVRNSAGMRIVGEAGRADTLGLLAPATANEIAALEASLPCAIPAHVRDLLALTRGFANGPLEAVDFGGVAGGFGMEDMFPHALALAHDGGGNYWIADLQPDSADWAPIYFACHDPPVIACQSRSLEHFMAELLRLAAAPHDSELATVRDRVMTDIWRDDPGRISVRTAASGDDRVLRTFAQSLDDSYTIFDLRTGRVGDGFAWGRYGPRTKVVRHGREAIFAYQAKSRWQRLLGR